MGWPIWGLEWETRVIPKVALVLPQGHNAEAPRDQVVVGVVPVVPDGHILEQMEVHPKDVVRMGPHLLTTTDHVPHPSITIQRELAREEVLHHILQHFCCH